MQQYQTLDTLSYIFTLIIGRRAEVVNKGVTAERHRCKVVCNLEVLSSSQQRECLAIAALFMREFAVCGEHDVNIKFTLQRQRPRAV